MSHNESDSELVTQSETIGEYSVIVSVGVIKGLVVNNW